MITPWQEYMAPAGGIQALADCHRQCRAAFVHQRNSIEHIVAMLRPDVIACLGAGVLNDIPYRQLVTSCSTLHLVDWLPGAPDFGVTRSIIEKCDNGLFDCAYCQLSGAAAERYCGNYRAPEHAGHGVCKAFDAGDTDPAACLAFRRADEPHIHCQDATGGYAAAFGARVASELQGVSTWRQAFRRGTTLARRAIRERAPLDIPNNSVGLVISSMLASQFEHEPYHYFSRQVAAKLGLPSPQIEKQFRPQMEALRDALLINQVAGHCDEIQRILASTGRCFMAFEMFHCDRGADRWFLVRQMHRVLDIVAERFHFDFDSAPQSTSQSIFETPTGRSIVHQYLLRPKE